MCICTFDKVYKYFFGSKDKFQKKTCEYEASVILEDKHVNNLLSKEEEDSFEIL